MKPFTANLINGLILLAMGIWGYLDASAAATDGSISPTVFIAPGAGLLLLLFSPGMRTENKVVAHIVVLLTFLLLIAFVMPLMRQEGIARIRVIIMMASCAFAMFWFIRSFIDARKAREAGGA